MSKNMITIIGLCMAMFQPTFGIEDYTNASTSKKSRTKEALTEARSEPKRFDNKIDDNAIKLYKARAEEMDKKSAELLAQSTELGTIADSLTNEAKRLESIARNSTGNVEIIQEAYKSAERAYRIAARAYDDVRKVELASATVELAAAKAAKVLYELLDKSKCEMISNTDFSQNEYVIYARGHMELRKISKENAKAAHSCLGMLLHDATMLRLERKKKVRSLQKSICNQGHIAPTNPEIPLSLFEIVSNDNQIKAPETDLSIRPFKS